jgi:hypothetical protein
MSDPQPPDLTDLLCKLFRAHDVEASVDGEWVKLPRPYMRARAAVAQETPHPNALVIQLDVIVSVMFGRVLVESFAGIGATRAAAIANALESFTANSLHVILSVFFNRGLDQVEREEWLVSGLRRSVTFGGAQYRFFGQRPEQFDLAWMTQLRSVIERQELPQGSHWIRFYYAQDASTTVQCEALLDNQTWTPVQDGMRQFSWPAMDHFYSVRLFILLQGGVETAELAGMICELRNVEDGALIEAMIQRGVPASDAELAVSLIPLAFGRVLLKTLVTRFEDHAIVMDTSTGREGSPMILSTQSVYREALALAQSAFEAGGAMAREEFSAIALRSSEVAVVNKALNAGSKPENLVLSSPVLMLLNVRAPAMPAPVLPAKRWWELWK